MGKHSLKIIGGIGVCILLILTIFFLKEGSFKPLDRNRINPKAAITITEDQAKNHYLTGEKINGDPFRIAFKMDPLEAPYRLNEVAFVDLTGDGHKELCVGYQYTNNIVSDFNSINVYDTLSLKQLFPTQNTGLYDSRIVSVRDKSFPRYGLDYVNYTKVLLRDGSSEVVQSEHSIRAWLDGSFIVKEYKKKLLCVNDDFCVYLENYSPCGETPAIRLTVYKYSETGAFIKAQDITVDIGKVTKSPSEITNMIEQGSFVTLEDKNGDGTDDLKIQLHVFGSEETLVYAWDRKQLQFRLCSPEQAKEQADPSDSPFQYSFQLDGNRYSLPVKADYFINNGWNFDEAGSLEAGESRVVLLKKDNHRMRLTICNLGSEKSGYPSCEVKGLSIKDEDAGSKLDFSIFDEISLGMSQEELERNLQNLYYYISPPQEGDIDYHILDDLYFEEEYGYLIHTRDGLITSIELRNPVDSNNREERTNSLTNHWLSDPVKAVEPDMLLPMEFNCIYKADINRDGKSDNIDLKLLDSPNGDNALLIVVNGVVNLIRRNTTVRDAYLISRSNGTCGVLFDLDEIDDYNPCCIYQLQDTRCRQTVEQRGHVVSASNTQTMDTLTLESYPYVIGAGWSAGTDYNITDAFDLVPVSDSRLADTAGRHGIKVTKEMEVTFSQNTGDSYRSKLEPGNTITLTETDFKSVLSFITGDGTPGSIVISRGKEENCCFLYYEGELLTDYFDESTLVFAG